MESKEFADGSCIIKEGDDGDFFYVIASGVCSVFIGGKNDDKEVRRLKVRTAQACPLRQHSNNEIPVLMLPGGRLVWGARSHVQCSAVSHN
jgi:CRP-like cAMP-binding protein